LVDTDSYTAETASTEETNCEVEFTRENTPVPEKKVEVPTVSAAEIKKKHEEEKA